MARVVLGLQRGAGNRAVARMLASGPPQLQRQAADEDMDEAAAAPEAEREADEDEDEAAGPEDSAEETLDPGPELDVAASEEPEGGVLARQPTKTPRRGGVRSVRGLSDRQVREVHRLVGDFLARLGEFERDRLITSEEAERYREAGEAMRRKADDFGTPRRLGAAEAAAFKKRGLKLRSNALRYWDLPKFLRRRAAAGRSTEGLKLISGFAITPPVLRVGHDEAARISFTLGKDARSVSAYILSDPESESTSYRFFNISPTPGYHHAIWDGTFQGSANRPPATGTYRVMISAQDATGRQEQVFDQIRVENPDEETVLPRNASGLDVTSLTFDGSALTLVDAGGNTIRAAAVSGCGQTIRATPRRRTTRFPSTSGSRIVVRFRRAPTRCTPTTCSSHRPPGAAPCAFRPAGQPRPGARSASRSTPGRSGTAANSSSTSTSRTTGPPGASGSTPRSRAGSTRSCR